MQKSVRSVLLLAALAVLFAAVPRASANARSSEYAVAWEAGVPTCTWNLGSDCDEPE